MIEKMTLLKTWWNKITKGNDRRAVLGLLLIQEPNGHFLLYVCPFQGIAELHKWYHLISILISLKDGSLCNTCQLLLTVNSIREQNLNAKWWQFLYLMLDPTIICKIANSSSREIFPSLSRSYILKATEQIKIVKIQCIWYEIYLIKELHFSFCSLELSLVSLFFLIGLKWANTCMNWRKLMESPVPSWKKACTILSPKGLIASSGMRSKSSRLNVPLFPRSRLVNLL